MVEALYTFSMRGQLKLVQDDADDSQDIYAFYNRGVLANGNVFWRCDQYCSPKIRCSATAITKRIGEKENVQFFGRHNHQPKK